MLRQLFVWLAESRIACLYIWCRGLFPCSQTNTYLLLKSSVLRVHPEYFNEKDGSKLPTRIPVGDEIRKTEQAASQNKNNLDKMRDTFVTFGGDPAAVVDDNSFPGDIESPITRDASSFSFRGLCSSKRQSSKNMNPFMDELALEKTNLVLGMERTLFAALNNAWLLAIGGIGLMSVGSNDIRAVNMGITIVCFSILCAVTAGALHFYRITQLRRNRSFLLNQTNIWAFFVVSFSVLALCMELHKSH